MGWNAGADGVAGLTAGFLQSNQPGLRTQVASPATMRVGCVRSSAQVAARGRQHLSAIKSIANGATSAQLQSLSGDARIGEIARMLAGKTITSKTREHASEMLLAADTQSAGLRAES